MSIRFAIQFDTRSKEILIDLLNKEIEIAEGNIRDGDYSEEAFIRAEELFRLKRGILYSKPEEGVNEIKPQVKVGQKVAAQTRRKEENDSAEVS